MVIQLAQLKKNKTKTAESDPLDLTVQLEDLKIIHGPVAPNKKAAGFEGWKPRYLQDGPRADGCKWSYMGVSLNGEQLNVGKYTSPMDPSWDCWIILARFVNVFWVSNVQHMFFFIGGTQEVWNFTSCFTYDQLINQPKSIYIHIYIYTSYTTSIYQTGDF